MFQKIMSTVPAWCSLPSSDPSSNPSHRPAKEGLIAAALFDLPEAPPTLLASAYGTYKSARAHTARFCHMIQQALQPLLLKYRPTSWEGTLTQ